MLSRLEGRRSSNLPTKHFFASGFLICGLENRGWAWVCLQVRWAGLGWPGLGAPLRGQLCISISPFFWDSKHPPSQGGGRDARARPALKLLLFRSERVVLCPSLPRVKMARDKQRNVSENPTKKGLASLLPQKTKVECTV